MNNRQRKDKIDMEIRFRADPELLGAIRPLVRKLAELANFPESEVEGIGLALEEALMNVIWHGYGGPCNQEIILQATRTGNAARGEHKLEFVIRDYGKQVDPASIRSRDLEDVRPGGLGVHLIRSLMDDVEYSCPPEGGMRLYLAKNIPKRK